MQLNNDDDDVEDFFEEAIEAEIYKLYGDKEGEAIINHNYPESDALEKNPPAVRALIDSIKIHSHDYEPISAVSKLFLSEESKKFKTIEF